MLLFLRRQPSRVALEVSAAATERSKEIQKAYQLFAIVFLFVLCHALRVSLNIQEFINLREKENDNRIGSTFRQLHHKVVREKRCVMIVHQRL